MKDSRQQLCNNIFAHREGRKTNFFSSVSPFALLSLFHPKERKMIVDKEHGHRNYIIPQGSYLEEPSVNRAKCKAKYGRIISGIFYSNETEKNLSLSLLVLFQSNRLSYPYAELLFSHLLWLGRGNIQKNKLGNKR